jgi:hypothetical protein
MKHKKVINAGFGNGGALSVSQVAYNVFAVNSKREKHLLFGARWCDPHF